MKYKIKGTTLPILEVELSKNDSMFTESGGMAWMDSTIEMETSTRGGIMKGLRRAFSGESFFMVTYSGTGKVTFSSEFPGKILDFKLSDKEELICQKDAFLAAESSVDLDWHINKKLGAGFFGGEGFILQKLTGPGAAFLEIDGEVVEYTLKKGETLKVNPAHIAAFEPTVQYSITTVKGIKNIFLGGEGLFLATLTGPGKIYLQTMPFIKLVNKIIPYVPRKD